MLAKDMIPGNTYFIHPNQVFTNGTTVRVGSVRTSPRGDLMVSVQGGYVFPLLHDDEVTPQS